MERDNISVMQKIKPIILHVVRESVEEIFEKYNGKPLTPDTLYHLKFELEKNGYNASGLSVSSSKDIFLIEENGIFHFHCDNGMWNCKSV